MIRHGIVLIVGFVGSSLISLPAWVKPLLSKRYATAIDTVSLRLGQPATYWHLAIVFFGFSILYASFLAWNEERDELENLLQKQPSNEPDLEGQLSPFSRFVFPDNDWPHLEMHVEIINRGAPTIVHRFGMWVYWPTGKKLFLADPDKSDPCFFENKMLHRGEKLAGTLISKDTEIEDINPEKPERFELWFQDFAGKRYTASST